MCTVHYDLEVSLISSKVGGFVLMQCLVWGQGSQASDSTAESSRVLQQLHFSTVVIHQMI